MTKYEKINDFQLSEEQIRAYDLYYGYTVRDVKRRYRVSINVAKEIWKAVADKYGTLPLTKTMVRRVDVAEFMKVSDGSLIKHKKGEIYEKERK